ncbi:MAG: hypothetical protein WD361_02440, partial [Gracilimonas sp.]
DTENDHWHIEEWKREKERLQKLVDEQTADLKGKNRELEIEAALDRVRARSMAMQKSEELTEVVRQIKEEIMGLGINVNNTQIGTDFTSDPYDGMNVWISVEGQRYLEKFHIPFIDHPVTAKTYETLNNDLDYFTFKYSKSEKNAYFQLLFEFSDFKNIPEERKNFILNTPGWVIFGVIKQNFSMQFARYNLEKFTHEEIDVFKRFGTVFGQAYTRFLDLQKAEAQAREAQIEAALERLRAKAMSMHHSDELDEVLAVLCEQFDILGILPMSAHMSVLDIEHNTFTFRETGKFGNRSFGEQTVALDAMDTWEDMVESWKNADPYSINSLHFPKETLPQVWEVFHESFASMPKGSRITPDDYPDGIYHTAGKHPYGYIGMNQTRKATQEEEQIVIKFANEFGRAYTRFLDLQKAEAQAREAKIEAALERVRARSMGMQKSEELIKVVRQIGQELKEMGIDVQYSQIWTDFSTDPDDGLNIWVDVHGQSYLEKFHIPYVDQRITSKFYEALDKNLNFFSERYSKSEKDQFFRFLFKNSDLKSIAQERKDLALNAPGWIRFTVILNNSCLHFGRYNLNEFAEEEKEIF